MSGDAGEGNGRSPALAAPPDTAVNLSQRTSVSNAKRLPIQPQIGHNTSMTEQPIATRPPSSSDKLLRDKFMERYVAQSDLLDKLAQQLITIELAVPGLYATVLKLTQGDKATVPADNWLYFTFACWFLALLLTLVSLVPRNWRVDTKIVQRDPAQPDGPLGLEDFFHQSAQYKRRLLIPAIIFFWLGILGAVFVLF